MESVGCIVIQLKKEVVREGYIMIILKEKLDYELILINLNKEKEKKESLMIEL